MPSDQEKMDEEEDVVQGEFDCLDLVACVHGFPEFCMRVLCRLCRIFTLCVEASQSCTVLDSVNFCTCSPPAQQPNTCH